MLAGHVIMRSSIWIVPATQVATILWLIFFAVLHSADDFSIINPIVSQIIYYFIALLAAIAITPLYQRERASTIIVYAFLLQSFIIILGFTSPIIAETVKFFQDTSQVEVAERYGGIRGLALSGGQFFNLSVAYAIATLLLINLYAKNELPIAVASFILFIFLIAAMFVGRTSYLGFIVGIAYLVFSTNNIKQGLEKTYRLLFAFSLWALLFLAIFYTIASESLLDKVFNHLLPFAYEFIFNYLDGKGISTVSTNELEKMYYPIEEKTWFFGDGRYLNSDGTYYGATDAGYMRNMLFGGATIVMVLFFYQWACFKFPKSECKSKTGWRSNVSIWIFILVAILHYKGEVVGYLVISQIMIFYLVLSNYLIEAEQNANQGGG